MEDRREVEKGRITTKWINRVVDLLNKARTDVMRTVNDLMILLYAVDQAFI